MLVIISSVGFWCKILYAGAFFQRQASEESEKLGANGGEVQRGIS